MRNIKNLPCCSHLSPTSTKNNIHINSMTKLSLTILISISNKNLLPPIFKNWFISCSDICNYGVVSPSTDKLFTPSYKKELYGKELCHYQLLTLK